MRTYKIYLLRHGLTEANDNGRYIGRTDLPLSPSGFAHLLDMKQTYVYPEAAHFYTSPLLRCQQTLSVLYPGCQPRVIPGLAECDFGEWEGRAVSELKYDEAFRGSFDRNSRRRGHRLVSKAGDGGLQPNRAGRHAGR